NDNPDAPVGVVGIVLSVDRSSWGDQEGTLSSGGVSITDQDDDFSQTYVSGGLALIVPVSSRITLRGGVSRISGKTEDTDYVEELGANLSLEETQKAWSFGASMTIWLGEPSRSSQ
ncbi:hypothetical protein K8I85_06695, partial [bacterium]|nr:hypothetical protein [bacterium]